MTSICSEPPPSILSSFRASLWLLCFMYMFAFGFPRDLILSLSCAFVCNIFKVQARAITTSQSHKEPSLPSVRIVEREK